MRPAVRVRFVTSLRRHYPDQVPGLEARLPLSRMFSTPCSVCEVIVAQATALVKKNYQKTFVARCGELVYNKGVIWKAGDKMNTTPMSTTVDFEKKNIRRDANFVGFILIALVGGQFLIGVLLAVGQVLGLLNLSEADYGLGTVGYALFTMLQYILYVAVPVLIVALILRRNVNPFPTCRVPRGTYGLAVFGGMAMAVLANLVASYVMQFFSSLGVPYPEMPDLYEPTLLSLGLNLISTAVFPAFLEEMAMRGYVLRALQPYGKRSAVIISAVLFGLIHGNVLQLPFAFILGLVLGWLTVQTGSIWPAVVFHFTNNAYSVITSWAEQFTDETEAITMITFLVFCAVGTVLFLASFLQQRGERSDLLRPIGNGNHPLPLSQRVATIITAPAFLAGGIVWLILLVVASLPQ